MAVRSYQTQRGEPTLKAERLAQQQLLDVQALDSRLDQLTRRRRTLPQLAEIADLELRRSELSDRLVEVRTEVDDLSREQRKADADVEQVKARRVRNEERLDKGQVGSPRDLENLQHELEALHRRISDLEDEELAVMERLEEAQSTLVRLEAALGDLDASREQRAATRDSTFAEIDDEVAEVAAQRRDLATSLPAELLTLYDGLRAKNGGVGAAALAHGRCGGCRLEMNAADLRDIAAAAGDDVVRCEECGRILVRTAESGV